MRYHLLLVDGRNEALTAQLRIRTLREFPGLDGLSVHFRPVRNDRLFQSAKEAGQLAYRILAGEGRVRSQLWVEYEILGEPVNVIGHSSDLLFALSLITAKWPPPNSRYAAIAATGVLDVEGAVHGVDSTAQKLAAAIRDLEPTSFAVIFYPAVASDEIDRWRASAVIPDHVELQPVAHLEHALAHLGYTLEKVYLRNPFRGLEHFGYEHHAIFFGRDREVGEVVEQLLRREQACVPGLLVEGASGSGKSSFVQAGVLPALLERRFQSAQIQEVLRQRPFSPAAGRLIWRPASLMTPVDEAALVASIHGGWSILPECCVEARTFAALIAWHRNVWPEALRFVWMIDQFEELFRLGMADPLIAAFGEFLGQLQAAGVWTLASVRSDAMPEIKHHESLRRVFGANEGQYFLPSLSGTALDAVITLPARAADLDFELGPNGKRLDQQLRDDAYAEVGSLPQLQFTLNELYLKRRDKTLTFAAYEQLGGLAGSIASTAERVLSAGQDDPQTQRAIPLLFRGLVSVDDTGRATRRYAPMSDLTADPTQGLLLQRLIDARLCVTDQRDGGAVVGFAHDTLLNTLPALTVWLKEEAGLLQTRELAQREAKLWHRHGQSDDWLATADKLIGYRRLVTAGIVLPETVRSFIDRSARKVRRNVRIKRAVVVAIGGLGLCLLIGSFALILQQRRAERAQAMAARRGDFLTQLLSSANPRLGGGDLTVAQLMDTLTPQVDALVGSEPLFAASLLSLIAKTNQGLGHYPQMLAASRRQLDLLRLHDGANADVLSALSTEGEALILSGNYRDAEAPLRQALALVEHQSHAEKQLGIALNDLGAALLNSEGNQAVEALYLRSIDAFRSCGAECAEQLADPLANLGVLRGNQGRYTEAAGFLRQALDIRQKYLPPDHPELLDDEYNYAAVTQHTHPEEAEPIFRHLWEEYRRALGPDQPDTLMARQGLAGNLLLQRRYQEAAAEALPAMEGLSRTLGESHQWTLTALGVYGTSACLAGNGVVGLKALYRVAEVRRSHASSGVWRPSGYDEVKIGVCLVSLQRYAEAEPLLRSAVATLETERGASYNITQDGYQALHTLYAGLGKSAEAATWQAKLLPPSP